MQLKIAPNHVCEVVALAYELSKAPPTPFYQMQYRPGGLSATDKQFYLEEASQDSTRYIHCDYIRGRSLKLYLRRHPKDKHFYVLPEDLENDKRWLDHYESDCLRMISFVRSLPENAS